jgi:multidrug efflux pump subunit AcrB
MVHLKQQQNGLALDALVKAQAATERAMKSKPRAVVVRDELEQTNQQIERVKQVIRRGKVEKATLELQDVNQKLESVSY